MSRPWLLAATGTDLYSKPAGSMTAYTTVGTTDKYHRQATGFTMYAGELPELAQWRNAARLFRAGQRGRSHIDHRTRSSRGATLKPDAGASVLIGSINQVTVDGSISAYGGTITLTGDTAEWGFIRRFRSGHPTRIRARQVHLAGWTVCWMCRASCLLNPGCGSGQ